MLILGIILTVLGFIVFQWSVNAQSKSFLERPMIFNSVVAVLIINLIWLALFASGFYSLWKVNPTIVIVIFGIYTVLWILSYFMRIEKSKAKNIFGIYKQLMKIIKILIFMVSMIFGVFIFVYGGYDDSPGAQGLGVLAFAGGIAGLVRQKKG